MSNFVGISPSFSSIFSQNALGVINIHEYYNMIILKFDHLLNILLSKHLFKTKFGTLGHLVIEIVLDFSVHPLISLKSHNGLP